MENSNQKLTTFFKKFANLLKQHDIEVILEAIQGLDKKNSQHISLKKEIDFVVNKTCVVFEINKKLLYSRSTQEAYEAKKCAFFILNGIVGIKVPILVKEFKISTPAVWGAIRKVNEMDFERIPADRKFKEKMDKVIKFYKDFNNENN